MIQPERGQAESGHLRLRLLVFAEGDGHPTKADVAPSLLWLLY
jgi:hypothetical protein